MSRNKYSPEIKQAAIADYINKVSYQEICKKYSIASIATLKDWVKNARKLDSSIPRIRNEYDTLTKSRVVQDYRNKIATKDICIKYGLKTPGLIYKWVREARENDPTITKRKRLENHASHIKEELLNYYFYEKQDDAQTQIDIARKFDLPKSTVGRWIKEARIKNPNLPEPIRRKKYSRKYSNEIIEAAIKDYLDRVDTEIIYSKYHIPISTIKTIATRMRKENPSLLSRQKKKVYSKEIICAAVNDYLFNKISEKTICENYGIVNPSTLRSWALKARKLNQKLPKRTHKVHKK